MPMRSSVWNSIKRLQPSTGEKMRIAAAGSLNMDGSPSAITPANKQMTERPIASVVPAGANDGSCFSSGTRSRLEMAVSPAPVTMRMPASSDFPSVLA